MSGDPGTIPHAGRHRRGGGSAVPASWTPPVPNHPRPHHHHQFPQAQAVTGVPAQAIDAVSTVDTVDFAQPLAVTESAAWPSEQDVIELESVRAQRTTVTLSPLSAREQHEAPVEQEFRHDSGLASFDLGSVPASVTPPRTWRKAAFFAVTCCGAVVVGLLFASSRLVSAPDDYHAGISWPGLQGTPALPQENSSTATDTSTERSTATSTGPSSTKSQPTSTPNETTKSQSSANSNSMTAVEPPGSRTSGGASTRSTNGPTSPAVPKKPRPTKAPFTAEDPKYWRPLATPPATLAAQSQEFMDTVTEDPAAAHALTTGQLRQQGPTGLADKYSDVAYYEVKHVEVRQYEGEGVTVCTVRVVEKDGSAKTEQHKLTFGENAKIKDAGAA